MDLDIRSQDIGTEMISEPQFKTKWLTYILLMSLPMLYSGLANCEVNTNPWVKKFPDNSSGKKAKRPWGAANPAPKKNQQQKPVYPPYNGGYAWPPRRPAYQGYEMLPYGQPMLPYMYPGYGNGYNPGMPGMNSWPGSGMSMPFFGW